MVDVKTVLKPFGSHGFLIGIGVAALGYFLAPQLKQSLRPAAVKGAQGVMTLGNKTKQILEESRDKISGLFEKAEMEKGSDPEKDTAAKVLKELMEERESSARILNELKESVHSLREEISLLKRNGEIQQS